jgi:hypothetical protein
VKVANKKVLQRTRKKSENSREGCEDKTYRGFFFFLAQLDDKPRNFWRDKQKLKIE